MTEREGPKKRCKIVELYRNDPQPILTLKLRHEKSGAVFERRSTPGHRFYVRNLGFVHADEIPTGSELMNGKGEPVILVETELDPKLVPVYNFEVEEAHTYFVGDSAELSVLSHNQNCEIISGERLKNNPKWTSELFNYLVEDKIKALKLQDKPLLREDALYKIYVLASAESLFQGVSEANLRQAIQNNKYYTSLNFKYFPPGSSSNIVESVFSSLNQLGMDELKKAKNLPAKPNIDLSKLSKASISTIYDAISDYGRARDFQAVLTQNLTQSIPVFTGAPAPVRPPRVMPNNNRPPR